MKITVKSFPNKKVIHNQILLDEQSFTWEDITCFQIFGVVKMLKSYLGLH